MTYLYFYLISDKLWKLDKTLKLTNKANLWVSDGSWTFVEEGGMILIKDSLENKVLGITENGKLILDFFDDNDYGQLWMKGEENNEGYFTLKHYESDKYLTAVPLNNLELKGNYKLIDILPHLYLITILFFFNDRPNTQQSF